MYYKYDLQISAPGTLDKVKSLEKILDKNLGNCFRIKDMNVQFENRDAIAAGDKIGIQISTIAQNEAAAFLPLNDKDEVWTWEEIVHAIGAAAGYTADHNALTCYPVRLPINGLRLPTGTKLFFNSICTGQDAADVLTTINLNGQYEKAREETDIDHWAL